MRPSLVLRLLLVLPALVPMPTLRADGETGALKARIAQLEAEIKALRERVAQLEAATAPKAKEKPKPIVVLPGDWGDADRDDIEAVCRSAAQEIARYMPQKNDDPIAIRHDGKRGPMVLFGVGPTGERRVLLSARDRAWSQFAYQFAHEYCHIQCNYRDARTANLWFEESLCETASLFALRRMAVTWQAKPPYGNWKSYAPSLGKYAEDRILSAEKLDGLSFAQWFQRNEAELVKTGVNRAKNQVIAAALLPLFEKTPEGWQAIRYLNQWPPEKDLSFTSYLRDWHSRVPDTHRSFVADIAKQFGITVP
jgi:hypothetical protein